MIPCVIRSFRSSCVSLKAKSFYEVLGVPKTATESDIKQAYFSLAKQYHPDLNKSSDSAKIFNDVNTAYETLIDKSKRANYDNPPHSPSFNQAFDSMFKKPSSSFKDFSDIFQDFSSEKEKRVLKGEDVVVSLEISLEESVQGVQKEVKYEKFAICSTCKAQTGKLTKCGYCNGAGFVASDKSKQFCLVCLGVGVHYKSTCMPCSGQGVQVLKSSEQVSVPAGVDSGQTLRMTAKGSQGTQSNGDLLVCIKIKPNDLFKREGFDVLSTVSISLAKAVLGSKVDVQTLYGTVQLEVPPGTSNGDKRKIPGMGAPQLAPYQSKKGDHVVSFKIKLPKSLNSKEKELFRALAKEEGELTSDDPPMKFKANLK